MAGLTNKGKFRILEKYYRGGDTFNAALVTSAAAPGPDINILSELTEIAAGNGYTTGGIALTGNATDFDVITEDDVNDRAFIQIKDLIWTAAGGNLPTSGSGARHLVLTDNNVTIGSREVINYWDLAADRVVSDTQGLTIQNPEFRLNEV